MSDDSKNLMTDTFKMPMLKGVGDSSAAGAAPVTTASVADDTRTRRTVRLNAIRPAGVGSELKPLPSGNVVSTDSGVISDPLAGRGTDSGVIAGVSRPNIKVQPIAPAGQAPASGLKPGALDDTRTRKTVALASLTPQRKDSEAPAAAASAPVSNVSFRAGDVDDTIRIQRHEAPAMPGGIGAATVPSPGISLAKEEKKPAPADSTHTQAIAKAAAMATQANIVLPEPQAVVSPETNTQAMSAVNMAKSTIKLKVQTPPPAEEAKEEVKEEVKEEAPAKPAVNLVRTPVKEATAVKKPAPAPAAAKPAAPAAKPAIAPVAPAAAPAASVAAPATPVAPVKEAEESSTFFTVFAVVAVIAVILVALVTAVQFINMWHVDWFGGEPVEIPLICKLGK